MFAGTEEQKSSLKSVGGQELFLAHITTGPTVLMENSEECLSPMVLLGALLVFVVTFYFSRYVSLGSIIGVLSIPALLHLTDRLQHVDGDKTQPTLWEAGTWNKPLMVFSLIAAGLAVWRHRSNIKRILAGTEDRLSARTPGTEPPTPEDSHPKEEDHAS